MISHVDRWIALLALALLFPLAAWPAPGGGAEPVEIFLYQRGYVEGGAGAATALTDAALKAFARTHPEIRMRVVGVPWGREGDLKLRTALLARRRIDLFRLAHDELPAYVPREGRLLVPIDAELTNADRADFGASALAAVTIGGRAMAWPLWSTAIVLVVNEDLLQRAGVSPPAGRPWTWDELTAALQKVSRLKTDRGEAVAGLNAAARPPLMEWAPLLMAHAGAMFESSGGGVSGADLRLAPGLAGALDRVAALRRAGLTAPGFGIDDAEAAQQGFLDGRTAMLMTSPGFLRRLESSRLRWRVLPPPTGDLGRPITTGALGCFAVVDSGDVRRIAAAQSLARWLTSREIAEAVPGWYLAPPARASVRSFYERPAYRPLAAILPTAVYLTPPGRPGFFERIVVPRFQAALLGEQTPAESIRQIRAAWDRQALR